jgi:hypothetical protein
MRPSFLTDAPAAPLTPDVAAQAPAASATPTATTAPTTRCTNCGADGCERYCPRCGQETHDLHRSLFGIFDELLDAFAGWDGKIPATLALLVRRPGGLTREFLAGRRARYLRPLRLYLSMSVLFFVSLSLVATPPDVREEAQRSLVQLTNGGSRSSTTPARTALTREDGLVRDDAKFREFLEKHRNEKGRGPSAWFKRHFVGGLLRLQTLSPADQGRVIRNAFFAKAPNMVFLLLPVFALLLRVLYVRRPVFYAEHFVFALHNHAFAYLAMTLGHVASVWLRPIGLASVAAVPLLWMPAYFFVSLRRVYGGSRRRTLAKFAALSLLYGTMLFVGVLLTALWSLVTLA